MYLFTLMMCIVVFSVTSFYHPPPFYLFFYRDSDKRNWIRPRFWFLFFGLYPLIGIASVGVLQISDKNWADHFWNIMNTLNFTRRQTCWCKISPCNQRKNNTEMILFCVQTILAAEYHKCYAVASYCTNQTNHGRLIRKGRILSRYIK